MSTYPPSPSALFFSVTSLTFYSDPQIDQKTFKATDGCTYRFNGRPTLFSKCAKTAQYSATDASECANSLFEVDTQVLKFQFNTRSETFPHNERFYSITFNVKNIWDRLLPYLKGPPQLNEFNLRFTLKYVSDERVRFWHPINGGLIFEVSGLINEEPFKTFTPKIYQIHQKSRTKKRKDTSLKQELNDPELVKVGKRPCLSPDQPKTSNTAILDYEAYDARFDGTDFLLDGC